ncbi:cytochrome P450 [Williamsia sp. 1138]|uniref:cytochrome P450 n=1 Tax=Williamsia sp. 1138 TaxID=1903117 RepID=UPI0011803423|nr:cytochrome P450 [Williamsia sp. 1138]
MIEKAGVAETAARTSYPIIRNEPFELADELKRARESEGLTRVQTWNGREPWLLCRHADVRQALSDPRFSTDITAHGYPNNAPTQVETEAGLFIRMDGPEHALRRRTLISSLTPKQAERHRPRIIEIVDETLDAMIAQGGPVDVVEDFALKITTAVICEILGVEHSDAVRVVEAMENIFDLGSAPEDRVAANHFVLDVIRETALKKVDNPDESLLSRLVNVTVASGKLEFEEIVTIGRFVIGAGHETTANMIGLGILAFLRNPDQLSLLMSDPSALAPSTVEEMLRYLSIVQVEPSRIATADIEVGGELISAGDGVVMSIMAANRDPQAFDSGDRSLDDLDVTREGISHHVAFGFGPHQCVGQNLARVELQVAWCRLFQRLPGLRLAMPVEDLEFKTTGQNYGLTRLLVEW